ncbi:MAG: fibronectin type III domain-containing protein [Gammaproteobacteria bacterium]|nr:fibronectin type III domain-containing protein [Gammaproteobacteria bacterium]
MTGITINWADNSEKKGLYVVEGCKQQIKRKGKNQTVTRDFREVGNIAVGKTSVIKYIVDLEAAYNLFRVKAVNDNGSSAWSNEIAI